MSGVIPLAAISLLAGGAIGWNSHRFYGKEPVVGAVRAGTPAEERVLAVLRDMAKTGKTHLAVPESDGRRLRLLAEAVRAQSVVEVGTSTGYSALWLCLAVSKTRGHVTTFEIDERRAADARQSFQRAGMDDNVTVVPGDAHKTLATLKGPIDLVFLDADKNGYVDYLNQLLPLVRPGGLILAHNVDDAPDYIRRIAADPQLETIRLTQGSGLTATLKKR
jgi:predicted O-methyltransferase YrrM